MTPVRPLILKQERVTEARPLNCVPKRHAAMPVTWGGQRRQTRGEMHLLDCIEQSFDSVAIVEPRKPQPTLERRHHAQPRTRRW